MTNPPRRLLPALLLLAVVLASRESRADEEPSETRSPPTISLAAQAGYAFLHRSDTDPSTQSGLAWGGQLRIYPTRYPHGFATSVLHDVGAFGPDVKIFDAAYSYRFLTDRTARRARGAGYLEVGPAIGFVRQAPPAPDHTVFGGRLSVAFDAYLGPLLLGFTLGYHGGVPLGGAHDAWEGALMSVARVGVAFDL